MTRKPKTVTRRKFVAQTTGAVISLGAAAGVNIAANSYSSLLNHYLGGRPTTVVHAEGSESWDSTYYKAAYRGRNQAKEAATELVAQIVEEGAVLLKNDNGALPLAAGTTISLLGRYAADPVYGGAGSGTVDSSDCVTLYQGIVNAGLTVNDTAFNFISSNYATYPKAAITMDDPSTAAYYIGEIPWSDYSSDAQGSISGTTAVIVFGRGGGEGGDLSRNLKGDVESGISSAFTENSETANYVDGQHELELTVEEKGLITAAKSACSRVVVLINASTTMELGPLMSGDYEVDAHPAHRLARRCRLQRRRPASGRCHESVWQDDRHLGRRLHRRSDLRQLRRQAVHGRLWFLRLQPQRVQGRWHRVLRGVQGGYLLRLPLLRDGCRRSGVGRLFWLRLRLRRGVPVWLWPLLHHL